MTNNVATPEGDGRAWRVTISDDGRGSVELRATIADVVVARFAPDEARQIGVELYEEAYRAEMFPKASEDDLLLMRHFGWKWNELVTIPSEMRTTIANVINN